MTDFKTWTDAQLEEQKWWGNFVNTFVEEQKQFYYAEKMEIYFSSLKSIDLFKQSILDIGSNAISMLLKSYNGGKLTVVDPIGIPKWALERYKAANINYVQKMAEDFNDNFEYDECWIYNVLQHVKDPEKIIKSAIKQSKVLRIFEWIGEYHNPDKKEDELNKKLHPNILTEADLNKWIGKNGTVEEVNTPVLKGKAYYGVFIK